MKVELLNIMGDDTMVANAARVSYQKEASNYTEEQNKKLLKYLYEHNHWSPFSHPQLQFRIECPIYVERQLVKTEAGRVFNSLSGRYVDFSDTYTTVPEKHWRKQSKSSKQGSEGFVEDEVQHKCNKYQEQVISLCKEAYNYMVSNGVAKEQARTILPLCLNTTMIWTGSLWTFIRLYKQRIKPDAQKEIQHLVQMMMSEVVKTGKFKNTLEIVL